MCVHPNVAGEEVYYCGCSWDDVDRTFDEQQIGIIIDEGMFNAG
jgi:hypothetical protein